MSSRYIDEFSDDPMLAEYARDLDARFDGWKKHNDPYCMEQKQCRLPGIFQSWKEVIARVLGLGLCSTAIFLSFAGIAYAIRLLAEWIR